jgi:hypothetical protein
MNNIEDDVITPIAAQQAPGDERPEWNDEERAAVETIYSYKRDLYLRDMMEGDNISDPRLAEAVKALFPNHAPRELADLLLEQLPLANAHWPLQIAEDSISPISVEATGQEDSAAAEKRKLLNGLFVEREDNKFFRIDGKKPALLDEGQKLRVVNKDLETFQAAIELAHAKGWQAIQVKGSERFRAEAWYQASLKGLQVEGYTPTDKDLQRLAEQQQVPQPSKEERETFKASLEAAENFALERDGGIVYPDSVNENRSFAGKVVKVLDSHVIQDLGRNTYAVHEKAKVGNPELGVRVDIKYKGREVEIQTPSKDRSNSITR